MGRPVMTFGGKLNLRCAAWINGMEAECVLDTGSAVSMVGSKILSRLGQLDWEIVPGLTLHGVHSDYPVEKILGQKAFDIQFDVKQKAARVNLIGCEVYDGELLIGKDLLDLFETDILCRAGGRSAVQMRRLKVQFQELPGPTSS